MKAAIYSGFVLGLLVLETAIACNSDYDCGYGNKCIKPQGSYSLTGTCVSPTDQYGNKDYNSNRTWGKSYGPKAISSCRFSTDCEYGYKCLIESGELYGLCVK